MFPHTKRTLLLLVLFSIQSCSSGWPDWLLKRPHAISPDGKAAVYQNLNNQNNRYKISVSTWVLGPWAAGGSGVFDYYYPSPAEAMLRWVDDSTVVIRYPEDAEIIRQERQTYFMGRHTNIVLQSMPFSQN